MKYRFPAIKGEYVDGRAFPSFVWNADIIYFDGPFLSLFSKEGGGDALFFWLDTDDRKHRWGVVDVDRDQLHGYLNSELSLRSILKDAETIFVFETTPKGRRNNITKIAPEALPINYWPKENSFLTDRIASDAAILLRDEKTKRYELQFTGEEIFVEDLSRIPRLYEQLYSFVYGLTHIDRPAVRDRIVRSVRDWTGGFSSVQLFSGLRSVIPTIHRARVADLYFASPGEIGMNLIPSIALKIADSVEILGNSSSVAEARYKDCYQYFRDQKLGGFEDQDERRGEKLSAGQRLDIELFVQGFLQDMGLTHVEAAFADLEIDVLGQLRALLAFYRRLRNLRSYVDRGILRVPKKSSLRPSSRGAG